MFNKIVKVLELCLLMLISFCRGEIGRELVIVIERFFFFDINVLDSVEKMGSEYRRLYFVCFIYDGFIWVRNDLRRCFLLVDNIVCIIFEKCLVVIWLEEIIIVCKMFCVDGGCINVFKRVGWCFK